MTNEAAAISPELIEVTQADRSAALQLWRPFGEASGYFFNCRDDGLVVQAFARHRLNTTRSPVLSDDNRELVKRLRADRWSGLMAPGGPDNNGVPLRELLNPDGPAAADLIEALSRSGMEG